MEKGAREMHTISSTKTIKFETLMAGQNESRILEDTGSGKAMSKGCEKRYTRNKPQH